MDEAARDHRVEALERELEAERAARLKAEAGAGAEVEQMKSVPANVLAMAVGIMDSL